MAHAKIRFAVALLALATAIVPSPTLAGDANAGAKLVQGNGCAGCHGATFQGESGPKLVGIEQRRTPAQIAAAIAEPKAPMPRFPFTSAQISDIVAYLSSLDGGENASAPIATLKPAKPANKALLTVRFPGNPPKRVTVSKTMRMGGTAMHGATVTLHATSDPHVFTGTVTFAMAGVWTLDVRYDGKHMTVPAEVSGG